MWVILKQMPDIIELSVTNLLLFEHTHTKKITKNLLADSFKSHN